MSTFPAVTGSQLIKALRKLGFEVIRTRGSHNFLQHPDGRSTVIPVHRGETIGVDSLLRSFETANFPGMTFRQYSE